MPLDPHSRLGRYEILALIGSGGMGEVYRARDERIGREVAVKVMRGQAAADSDSLRRFEQEARAAGLLNHPNIVAVHDVDIHSGTPYVVSELLDGETLRARIDRGRLPPRKAVEYSAQIARGLAAAHDKGIVHRDLKPENLFLTSEGRVKILDFGVAKLTEAGPAFVSPGDEATIPAGTVPGLVFGTIEYMSPEQIRGLPVDSRSDLFSLGAILYEMLAGERAFRRDSAAETMSAILTSDPRVLETAADGVPPALWRIIQHCLEKHPNERFQSARDLAFDLEAAPLDSGATPALAAASRRRGLRLAAVAAVALGLAAVALALLPARFSRVAPAPRDTVRIHRFTDAVGLEESPAISPDGKSVAFTAEAGGRQHIWIRLLASGMPLRITRDDADHLHPRWSPDSSSILYYSPASPGDAIGTLWEIPALGGAPRRIADSVGGADVSRDGRRLAFFDSAGGQPRLIVANRDGSDPRSILTLDARYYYLSPRWSPDGSRIAYQRGYVFDHDVFVADANGGEPQPVTRDGSMLGGLAWWPDGSRIVFSSARGTTVLYLPPFNLWSAPIDGGAATQLTFGDVSYVEPDVDRDGRIFASRRRMQGDIWKFPVDGTPAENVARATRITAQTGQVQTPSPSPDDREVVYLSDSGGHGNLWVKSLASGEQRQITFEQDPNVALGVPVWSPDGTQIAFFSNRTRDGGQLGGYWVVRPDGSQLKSTADDSGWGAWSPDGRWFYYAKTLAFGIHKIPADGGEPVAIGIPDGTRPSPGPNGELYYAVELRRVTGGADFEIRVARPENGPSTVLTRIPASRIPAWQLIHPTLSPDGDWLAVPLTDGVVTNIWAISTSSGELKRLTDFNGRATFIARRLSWSPDGRAIYAAVGEGDADIVALDGLGR